MYNNPDSSKILPILKSGIDRYVKDKIPTGGFLQAVLENDLAGAIGRADIHSMGNMQYIIAYCYNEIPHECWGSKEKVKNWLASKKETA